MLSSHTLHPNMYPNRGRCKRPWKRKTTKVSELFALYSVDMWESRLTQAK